MSEVSQSDFLKKFKKAAEKQKHALQQGGWGHAIWCNYQRESCDTCNCGVADIQTLYNECKNINKVDNE